MKSLKSNLSMTLYDRFKNIFVSLKAIKNKRGLMRSFGKQFFYSFLVIFSIILSTSISYAGEGKPFDRIVFFGDSLTDNGNLYSFDGGFMPSDPYYKGRFSNGPTWAEYTATYYQDKASVTSKNKAYGGETAVFRASGKNLPYSMYESYWKYHGETIFRDRSTTLFFIWIGSNDYLNGSEDKEKSTKDKIVRGQTSDAPDVQELTNSVVDQIKLIMQYLIDDGVQDFVVINVPDYSQIPYGLTSDADIAGNLKALSIAHNEKLVKALDELRNNNKTTKIQLYDVNAMFNALLSNPSTFNAGFQVNITNTTDACWNGGYSNSSLSARMIPGGNMTPVNAKVDANQVAQDYMKYLNQNRKTLKATAKNDEANDIQSFANYVADSPALSEAYSVTKKSEAGEQACSNPDNYVFWDHVHPTAVIHKALSQEMIKFIDANFKTVN